MKLRRDTTSRTPSTGRRSAPASQARPSTQAYNNTGGQGLPGSAGYPDGPRTELPFFFNMRRPDGRNDPPPRRNTKKFSR